MTGAAIVWFRQDLRLRDNPALHAANATGQPVVPVYIWSPAEEGGWAPGSASRWWLHHSLQALESELAARGSRLILATGPALQALQELVRRTGASAVYWNRRYEPAAVKCASQLAQWLRRARIKVFESNGSLLSDPSTFHNQTGKPYQVYTAFQRALLRTLDPGAPLAAPRQLRPPTHWPASKPLRSLQLIPRIKWYESIAVSWQPGEEGAQGSLRRFLRGPVKLYRQARDFPALEGTSRLSPHLHFGEIGPRQIWHSLGAHGAHAPFLRQIVWREFAYHLLHHFPLTPEEPLRAEFARFPWKQDRRRLQRWQQGQTGVPMVDAGMRQLWSSGWMHNRVRLVAGSFLVKNLLIPWEEGARWFWDTLVDADLANNTLNWQWVAGCGADAAPYFRIFNPRLQAKRFDPQERYVRRWLPELGAPGYPQPVVDLAASRERALEAYQQMRRAS